MIKSGKITASESECFMVAIAFMPLYLLQTLPLHTGFTSVFPGNSWTIFTRGGDADVIMLLLLLLASIGRKHVFA